MRKFAVCGIKACRNKFFDLTSLEDHLDSAHVTLTFLGHDVSGEIKNRDQLNSENLTRIVPESSRWSQARADFEKRLEKSYFYLAEKEMNKSIGVLGSEETSGNNLPKIIINVTNDKSQESELNHLFKNVMKKQLQVLDPSSPQAELIRNNDIKIVCHGVLPSKDLTSEKADEIAPESIDNSEDKPQ